MSGRTLLATSEMNVYSFNIEDCTEEMPTQSPSSWIAPSSSLLPSQEPLSSSPPSSSYTHSSSLSPTTCEYMMVSNSQRIETSLTDPQYLTMDVDDRTTVLVVKDRGGSDNVMFYKSAMNDEWVIDEGFNLGDLRADLEIVVAISGMQHL